MNTPTIPDFLLTRSQKSSGAKPWPRPLVVPVRRLGIGFLRVSAEATGNHTVVDSTIYNIFSRRICFT